MSYRLSKAEQETVILWDRETDTATIDTADPAMIRKLDKLAADYPDTYQCTSEDALYNAKRYECPKSHIRFAKPPSEQQREASRQRAILSGFGRRDA